MILPVSVRIGPHVYDIRTDPETGRLLRDENSRGDSRPDHLLIRLDLERPHTAAAETLLHEIIHCAWSQTSLRADDELDHHQEAIVTGLSPLLLQVLRDNPDLVAYLTSPC